MRPASRWSALKRLPNFGPAGNPSRLFRRNFRENVTRRPSKKPAASSPRRTDLSAAGQTAAAPENYPSARQPWKLEIPMQRKRIKHAKTFEERLQNDAIRLREQARTMPPGKERELLLRKARDTAA